MTAESILLLALAVRVGEPTGSSGLAGAPSSRSLPPTTLAPLVGWIVDRYPRQPLFVAAHLVTAGLLTPLFAVRDRTDLWLVYLVAIFYGLTGVAVAGFVTAAVPVGLLRMTEPAWSRPKRRCCCRPVRTCSWPRSAELGAGLRYLADEPALRRALLGSLVMGFSESLTMVGLHTLIQRRTPPRLTGRTATGAEAGRSPVEPTAPGDRARRARTGQPAIVDRCSLT